MLFLSNMGIRYLMRFISSFLFFDGLMVSGSFRNEYRCRIDQVTYKIVIERGMDIVGLLDGFLDTR